MIIRKYLILKALNAVQEDSSKEIHKMREQNRRLMEDLEYANEKLGKIIFLNNICIDLIKESIKKERDVLEKKEKGL